MHTLDHFPEDFQPIVVNLHHFTTSFSDHIDFSSVRFVKQNDRCLTVNFDLNTLHFVLFLSSTLNVFIFLNNFLKHQKEFFLSASHFYLTSFLTNLKQRFVDDQLTLFDLQTFFTFLFSEHSFDKLVFDLLSDPFLLKLPCVISISRTTCATQTVLPVLLVSTSTLICIGGSDTICIVDKIFYVSSTTFVTTISSAIASIVPLSRRKSMFCEGRTSSATFSPVVD